MRTAKGYALWLMPSGDSYEILAQTILRLSRQYSTPFFEPHVTLLGGLLEPEEAVLSKTRQLAALVRPFGISLGSVDSQDEYFRCLFIRAKKTEALMQANSRARDIFNRHTEPPYLPHLSLMYGSFAPALKQSIIATIGRYFDMGFEVGSIHLISARGESHEWKKVRAFPLR